jgi:hypothetical protein
MHIIHRPDLLGKSYDELYSGLTDEQKKGVDRVMWCFRSKIPTLDGIDLQAAADFSLNVDDLRLLYDPLLPPELTEDATEEEITLTLAAIDPVIWVREFLKFEPRVYQTIMMRDKSRTRAFRNGRRTGKTTCMLWEAIHFCYTNPDVRVIIVCPLEAQIKLMWEMIDDMLLNSGIRPLKAALEEFGVVGKIRKPWEITFANGSKIKAFTSGARSGGKADSVRGNEAHMIIIDEMDLMMPDDLNAITAMMQKTSDRFKGGKRLIVSSTPNGRRDMFYVFCKKKNIKEFWLPSFVNPFFTPADEAEQKDFLTEAGFVHEIGADWGQQATGVFKTGLLDVVAKPDESYSYSLARPTDATAIIMGVDWDKYGAGVNIVVVANIGGILKLIWREELDRTKHEHTLGAGVKRIEQLDQIFRCNYIYCDKGYGERQWEELVELLPNGEERVIGRNFSSSVEETDPVTGARVKEEFKPFMVDNAVQLYERRKVRFPRDDEKFVAQVGGYVQTRVSATGRPVFASMDPERIGDHALDAWMMSLLGHTEKYGDLIIQFESIMPRTVSSNAALTPGDSKEDREKKSLDLLRVRRPMTSTNRLKSSKAFVRGTF